MRERDLALDALRAAACFGVIVLHVAATVVLGGDHIAPAAWTIGKAMDAVTRWCVPVFVMVTGALLLPDDGQSAAQFYRKRLPRVLIPLAFWTLAYWLLRFLAVPDGIAFPDALWELLDGSAYFHLWYIYMLAGLLFWVPVLRAVLARDGHRGLLTVAVTLYAAGLIGAVLPLNFGPGSQSTFFHAAIPFVAYLAFGHLLWSRGLPWPVWLSVLAFAASGAAVFALTEAMLRFDDMPYDTTYSAFDPLVLLGAVAVFAAFMRLKGRPARGLVGHIAQVSLGIYLIHPMLLFVADRVTHAWLLADPALAIPVLALGVFLTSWAACSLIERIPLLRPLVR